MRVPTLGVALVLAAAISAQTSVFVPDNSATSGGANVIPFGQKKNDPTWGNQIYQCLIPASYANNIPRRIVDLGFIPTSTTLANYGRLVVRMGLTQNANLSPTFANNLGANPVTVLDVQNYTWHLTPDQWTRIGLERGYTWIPQLGNLVIEILAMDSGGQNSTSIGGFRRSTTIERGYAVGWSGTPPTSGSVNSLAAAKVELVVEDAEARVFGESCVGSAGTPTLGYKNDPKIGSVFEVIASNCPSSGVALLMNGFNISAPIFPLDLTPLGATGCQLYVDPNFSFVVPIVSGTATLRFPVPNDRGLLGLAFWQQYAIIDPPANKLGLVLTEFGRILIGS